MILYTLPSYEYLGRRLLKLTNWKQGRFKVGRFPNQELTISLQTSPRGKKCAVLGGTAPPESELISLLLLSHTLKKEGAKEVSAIIPYLGYSRQDMDEPGKSWALKWLGEALKTSGINKVITVDAHSTSARQLFPIQLVSITSSELFAKALSKQVTDKITLVAPDEGALDNCKALKRVLHISRPIAYFKKERLPEGIVLSEPIGKLTKQALIANDILDTGETLINCVEKLRRAGVKEITIAVAHGLFTGNKWQKLWKLGVQCIYCSDSFPQARKMASKKIIVLPVSQILAKHIT